MTNKQAETIKSGLINLCGFTSRGAEIEIQLLEQEIGLSLKEINFNKARRWLGLSH